MKNKNEKNHDGLFAEKIIKDGNIEMFSIYDFPNFDDLTDFIKECRRQNSLVRFENENIIIGNEQKNNERLVNYMKMIIAFAVVQDPRYLENYGRYLKTKGTPLNPESN